MTAREALRLGDARRRRRCSGATTSARSSPASRPTSRSGATDGLELGGADDLVAGLVLSGPHRVDRLVVGGEDVVRGGALVRADEAEIARAHRVQARRFARMSCSVSTHVLDTAAGRPAAGVAVELLRDGAVVAAAETDADGRARLADALEPGTLRARLPSAVAVLPRVELQVELEDGHYHVPLLVSPYGCASYRGS